MDANTLVCQTDRFWSGRNEKFLKDQVEDLPTSLYHFTNSKAFQQILENKEVWGRSIFNQSDPTELRYANLLLKQASMKLDQRSFAGHSSLATSMCRVVIDHALSKNFSETLHTFIISLTANSESMALWKSYGHQGKGFCLGFAPVKVGQLSLVDEIGKSASLWKVVYQRAHQEAIFEETLDAYLAYIDEKVAPFFDQLSKAEQDEVWKEIGANWLTEIQIRCCLIKHPSFEFEKEWRIIFSEPKVDVLKPSKSALKFDSELKPYVPVPFGANSTELPLCLSSVICGPTHHEEAISAAIKLLENAKLPEVKVEWAFPDFRAALSRD